MKFVRLNTMRSSACEFLQARGFILGNTYPVSKWTIGESIVVSETGYTWTFNSNHPQAFTFCNPLAATIRGEI